MMLVSPLSMGGGVLALPKFGLGGKTGCGGFGTGTSLLPTALLTQGADFCGEMHEVLLCTQERSSVLTEE